MISRTKVVQLVSMAAVWVLVSAVSGLAGPRDHADGLLLRLSAGGGAAQSEIKDTGDPLIDQLKFSGPAGEFNFAIGAIVAPNLALHGTVWGWLISEPDVEINGAEVGSMDNAELSLSAIGAGVTYYLMPANIYLSGSLGIGFLSAEYRTGNVTTTFESDAGFAMDATVGKEWWVGDKWALGAALGVSYHGIPDGEIDRSWKGPSLALRFSATYN